MSTAINLKSFTEFLSYFPKMELPLTIQYSDFHSFSKTNDVLPDELLAQFIVPNLDFEIDEFTEFLPCLQYESSPEMYHVIIWTARLMHYSFYLMNFNTKAVFLHSAEIAAFYTKNEQILQRMAHLDAEGGIYVLEGNTDQQVNIVNPESTQKWQIEILPDGTLHQTEVKL